MDTNGPESYSRTFASIRGFEKCGLLLINRECTLMDTNEPESYSCVFASIRGLKNAHFS
jgi:hypothetical protein